MHDVAEATERLAGAVALEGDLAADHGAELMQAEGQPRGDTEVAAAASEPPQKLWVLIGARVDDGSVRRDELGAHEVVARQAVLRRQMSDPPAEREPADPGRADDAAGCHEPMLLGRCVEVEPRRASSRIGDLRLAVDVDLAHPGQVDHQPVVEHAMARRVVAASANRHVEVVHSCEVERGRHVRRTDTLRDHRGAPVDEPVEADPGGVVSGVRRREDGARERVAQLANTAGFGHRAGS